MWLILGTRARSSPYVVAWRLQVSGDHPIPITTQMYSRLQYGQICDPHYQVTYDRLFER